jgi:hypothetical protein
MQTAYEVMMQLTLYGELQKADVRAHCSRPAAGALLACLVAAAMVSAALGSRPAAGPAAAQQVEGGAWCQPVPTAATSMTGGAGGAGGGEVGPMSCSLAAAAGERAPGITLLHLC